MKIKQYLKLALIESRKARTKIVFVILTLIVGVSANTAVKILIYSFEESIHEQVRELLGADFSIHSNFDLENNKARIKFEKELSDKKVLEKKVNRASLLSMLNVKGRSDNIKNNILVNVIALDNNFPFYGSIETYPKNKWNELTSNTTSSSSTSASTTIGKKPQIFLMPEVLEYLKLKVGQTVYIGKQGFEILGTISNQSISSNLTSFAPNVFIHKKFLNNTGLINLTSKIKYSTLYKLKSNFDIDKWKKENFELARKEKLNILSYKESLGGLESFINRLSIYMSLLSLIILVLSGVGVGSTLNSFIQGRIKNAALYRVLGLLPNDVFKIYLSLALLLGIIASLLGAVFGYTLIYSLSELYINNLKNILPFKLKLHTNPILFIYAITSGVGMTLVFILYPIYKIKRVTPLRILRHDLSISNSKISKKENFKIIFISIIIFILTFFITTSTGFKTNTWKQSLIFMGLLFFALIIFWIYAIILIKFINKNKNKNIFSNFHFRTALSNITRPLNQTKLIISSIGMSFLLLTSIIIFEESFQNNLNLNQNDTQPNFFVFDVQKSQAEGLKKILIDNGAKKIKLIQMVMGRLKYINNKSVLERKIETDRSRQDLSDNLLTNELFLGFRNYLIPSEKVIEGKFWNSNTSKKEMSVDKIWANSVKVGVGDKITFDIQGYDLDVEISNIRKIRWSVIQANSFLLFPENLVKDLPYFYVGTFRMDKEENRLILQNEIINKYSNINLIYLGEFIKKFFVIFQNFSIIIKFLAIFTFLNGLIILTTTIYSTRFERIKETILYKVLGAVKKDLNLIVLNEYFILSILTLFFSAILAFLINFIMFIYFLEIDIVFPIVKIFCLGIIFILIITTVAWFFSRSIMKTKPIEVLK